MEKLEDSSRKKSTKKSTEKFTDRFSVVSKWGSVAMGVYIERCTDDISVIAWAGRLGNGTLAGVICGLSAFFEQVYKFQTY